MQGRVHSIETLGALDGPGLRCVVFLQGCPLRCRYCHNPDTWDPAGGQPTEAADLVRTVVRQKPYFGTRGGLTLSGGEPLMQAGFAAEVLARARGEGIHTALDTAGWALEPDVERALDATDLVILDVKHADAERHRELTGACLDRTLTFMARVGARGIALWVRQVIVPGWNDSEECVRALARIVAPVASLERVELLPYHDMAAGKWKLLGREYPLAGTPPAREADVAALQASLGRELAGLGRGRLQQTGA